MYERNITPKFNHGEKGTPDEEALRQAHEIEEAAKKVDWNKGDPTRNKSTEEAVDEFLVPVDAEPEEEEEEEEGDEA